MPDQQTTQHAADTSSTNNPANTENNGVKNDAPSANQEQQANQNQQSNSSPGAEKPAPWGETWREEIAGDDAAELKRLARYATPKDVWKKARELEKKISDGSYKKPLGDKATAEEIAEYRRVNGIPDDPAKYFESLPNGLVLGDEDKPIFEGLAKHMHALNVEPKVMHAFTDWYYKWQDEAQATMHENNVKAKAEAEDALRDDWAADFRSNLNLVDSFVGSMPQELQEELYKSVTPDGKQIMNNPKMLQWLAQQARELNYTGSVTGRDQGSAKSLEAEIDSFRAKMGDRSSDYWKGPNAEKNQARYRELLQIQERIKQRAA